MTQKHLLLLALLLFAVFLSSCSPGHIGNNEISFVRNGHLWTIDPDGANAFEVTLNSTPVIGYSWSPDHRIFAFRTLDSNFSKTHSGRSATTDPVTGLTNDVPSVISTIGIDGGTPIPIAVSSADLQHSNAWWNPAGNRLLYREESTTVIQNSGTQSWWISQNDQPLDIARKLLPYSYSIPSLSMNGMAIGNSSQGIFTTPFAGTQFQFILPGVLPGHPLPASLERILWQPAHQNPSILYAIATGTSNKVPSFLCKGGSGEVGSGDPCGRPLGSNTSAMQVQLILRDSQEHSKIIAICSCTQFAWSPDGNSVLFRTGTQYTIFNIYDHSSYTVSAESGSVPYWSPDSRFLILDGLHTLQLINITNQRHQALLSDLNSGANTTLPSLPTSQTLLQPISNNIWSTDSQQFLFLTRNRLVWQGKNLVSGKGLYTVSIDANGRVQGSPSLVDSGNDAQVSWTYEDPDASFIF